MVEREISEAMRGYLKMEKPCERRSTLENRTTRMSEKSNNYLLCRDDAQYTLRLVMMNVGEMVELQWIFPIVKEEGMSFGRRWMLVRLWGQVV